jgi:hypothetical protein
MSYADSDSTLTTNHYDPSDFNVDNTNTNNGTGTGTGTETKVRKCINNDDNDRRHKCKVKRTFLDHTIDRLGSLSTPSNGWFSFLSILNVLSFCLGGIIGYTLVYTLHTPLSSLYTTLVKMQNGQQNEHHNRQPKN